MYQFIYQCMYQFMYQCMYQCIYISFPSVIGFHPPYLPVYYVVKFKHLRDINFHPSSINATVFFHPTIPNFRNSVAFFFFNVPRLRPFVLLARCRWKSVRGHWWNDTDRGKLRYQPENLLPHCHLLDQKESHIDQTGTEPETSCFKP